jgi:hypothetical protein
MVVHLAVAVPDPADLRHGGDDHHGGGDVDVEDLEGGEEEDDREQVEEEFHGWNYKAAAECQSSAASKSVAPFPGAKVGLRGALLRATGAGRLCKAFRGAGEGGWLSVDA